MAETKTKVLKEESHKAPIKYQEVFDIVENDKNYYIGVAGKLVTPKTFASQKEAEQYIDSKPWDLIVNLTCICMDLSTTKK